jgi:hypothetical protein
VASFVYYQIGWLNLALFLFNMLPAFPMDGGRILRAFLQQFFMARVKATWIASRIGRFVAILMALSVVYSFLAHSFQGFMRSRLCDRLFDLSAPEREYRMVLMEEVHSRSNPSRLSLFRNAPPHAPARRRTGGREPASLVKARRPLHPRGHSQRGLRAFSRPHPDRRRRRVGLTIQRGTGTAAVNGVVAARHRSTIGQLPCRPCARASCASVTASLSAAEREVRAV